MFGLGKPTIITDQDKVEELLTRGVSEVIEKESIKKKLLSGRRLKVKLGIDPTSPDLHLGRSVTLLKLKDFQDLGHQVVFIIGDGTGVIGDTSDKESERPMLSKTDVVENAKTYFKQVGKILDTSLVEKHYNSEWLSKLKYDDIGEQADQFSVADFIARDNIKKRIDSGKRVSLREVLYPLMQGYDSVAIKADVEIGGTDQRFNLLSGRKLQSHYKQEPQDIVTTNLIEGIDGRKMSSSWGNTINILEGPIDMYGKVMRLDDSLIVNYFIHTTRLPLSDVDKIEGGLSSRKLNPRDAKMRLAYEIVSLYHGFDSANQAQENFINTFQKRELPGEVKELRAPSDARLSDVLVKNEIVSSKKEFSRLIGEGAIKNADTGDVISDPQVKVSNTTFKIGKHRFVKIIKE